MYAGVWFLKLYLVLLYLKQIKIDEMMRLAVAFLLVWGALITSCASMAYYQKGKMNFFTLFHYFIISFIHFFSLENLYEEILFGIVIFIFHVISFEKQ